MPDGQPAPLAQLQNVPDGHEVVPVRIHPHSIEAEQALLGALLLNNEVYEWIRISAADFYDPVHGRIFEAAEKHIREDRHVSPVTLKPFLANDEGLAELGGTDYLARLAGSAISVVTAPDYATVIRDLRQRRDALDALEKAQAAIIGMGDVPEAFAALETAVSEDTDTRRSVYSIAEAMTEATKRMNQAFQGERLPGVDLGIPELTEKMGNALPGEVILLGGRPSMGKSAIALEMAKRCAKAGTAVVYWCGEMAPEDNGERMMSSEARENGCTVAYHAARRGKMRGDQFKALLEAARSMESLPMVIVEPSIKRMDRLAFEIRREVHKFRRTHENVLVVVDYLQMIETDGRGRYDKVTDASAGVKRLAIDLRVPVLCLSQLSRQVETRDNKRPQLSDLRESGQIEQDANTVLFCYRDEYYLERMVQAGGDSGAISAASATLDNVRGELEIIIAKQRSGPIDTVIVGFDGATNSILPRPDRGYVQEDLI